MKTEVYSWRVSTEVKTGLEREARRRKMSFSGVLDLAAREWLNKSVSDSDGDEEQLRLHQAALKCCGAFKGETNTRSENVREEVRSRLRQKHGR